MYLKLRQSLLQRALPDGFTHEERSHSLDIPGGLLRPAHGLNAGRKRVKFASNEADDKVVVIPVDAEARQANVVRVSSFAESVAYLPVLAQNRSLLFRC